MLARLYNVDNDEIFRKYEHVLLPVFNYYSVGSARKQNGKKKRKASSNSGDISMGLDDWDKLLKVTEIYQVPHFTKQMAKLCFLWSRMVDVEEAVSTRDKDTKGFTLTFIDFLEALMRVADIIGFIETNEAQPRGLKK